MEFFKRVLQFWLWATLQTEPAELPLESSSSDIAIVSSAGASSLISSDYYQIPSLPKGNNPNKDCIHGPQSRGCWTKGFDIQTDYDLNWPSTNVTRKYLLVLTNGYIAPDNYNVSRMLINGTYPGPVLEADWGDNVEITVINKLTNFNGSSIHWHGLRQLGSTWEDGVPGITQCPITPGRSYHYKWRATQYGVSWYHSHFSLQYPDGLVGPLKLNGPTSANYDKDLGPVLITDWLHKDAFSQFQLELLGRPPAPDSNLLNGKGPYYCCPSLDPKCLSGESKYSVFNFTEGLTYKMSIVNSGWSTHFTFWIDGHDFLIVASDFVPIKPYPADTLNIAIGQRYDIIIRAKQNVSSFPTSNFWIHARDCSNVGARSNLGIIRYDSKSTDYPLSPHPSRLCQGCLDEMEMALVPIVNRTVGKSVTSYGRNDSLEVGLVGFPDPFDLKSTLHKWVIKDSSLYLDWREPSLSLLAISEGTWTNPFPPEYNPLFLNYTTGQWAYFLIEGNFTKDDANKYRTSVPVAHPIHIHGHDFVILAQGNHTFDPTKDKLNLNNPPRRDVALLPVNGFLVVAFIIDNPGTWILHCHIALHASGGLALQFIEQQDKIIPMMKKAKVYRQHVDTCATWGAFYTAFNEKQNLTMEDSGI